MADLAVEVGCTGLELSAGDLGDRSVADFERICRERGLAISCINAGCDMSSEDETTFEKGVDEGRRLVDMAVELDCKVVMPLPGLARDWDDKPRATARIAEGLRHLVGYAQPLGVRVTLEDFPSRLAVNDSIAGIRELLAAVPGLGLTFDNGNWVFAGDDPVDAVNALAPYICNAHLKDWESCPPPSHLHLADGTPIRGGRHGQGILDQPAILAALHENGYDGFLAFEYEGPLDHAQATREGMAYLRDIVAGL
jgi:sugar phosphate isomerase/epimerase